MNHAEPLIRNISDTAHWVAVYRADETDRRDALFRDPHARALAGERGEQIARTMKWSRRHPWPFVMRTYLFDQFITQQVRGGADLVINLAAGLDTRPYRLELPAALRWVEIDLPGILDHKSEMLKGETPRCALERVRADLADAGTRAAVLANVASDARRILIISEGLLIYLAPEQVRELARDLAGLPAARHWILDLASPGLLRYMQRSVGRAVDAAGAPFRFAPAEGPDYFLPLGWQLIEVQSMFRAAASLKRLPFFFQLMSFLPDPPARAGNRPWSGVCVFARV